jgi:uncharacterized protein YjiS (DUF1127 family)
MADIIQLRPRLLLRRPLDPALPLAPLFRLAAVLRRQAARWQGAIALPSLSDRLLRDAGLTREAVEPPLRALRRARGCDWRL